MALMDEILKARNLNYDKLTPEEKVTLNQMVETVQVAELTASKMLEYIRAMRHVVELELTQTGLNEEQDTMLKARLRNYMLFETILTAPQKARADLEAAIENVSTPLG